MVGEIFSRIKEEEKDGNCRHLCKWFMTCRRVVSSLCLHLASWSPACATDWLLTVRVSFLEIHNDDIRDLLDPSSKVKHDTRKQKRRS